MIRFALITFACFALVASQPNGSRVVGGKDAKPGQFPYQALVYVKTLGGSALCGGVCKYIGHFFQVPCKIFG